MLCMSCGVALTQNERGYCSRCGGSSRLEEQRSRQQSRYSEFEHDKDLNFEVNYDLPSHPERLAAALVDALIVTTIAYLFWILGFLAFGQALLTVIQQHSIALALQQPFTPSYNSAYSYIAVAFVLIGILIPIIYSVAFETSRFKATPGKILFGLEVSDALGAKLGIFQSSLRFLMRYNYVFYIFLMFACLMSLPLLGVLMLAATVFVVPALIILTYGLILIDGQKRGLHDKLAATLVTKKYQIAPARAAIGYLLALLFVLICLFGYSKRDEKGSSSYKSQHKTTYYRAE